MSLLRQFFGTSSNTWVRALIVFCLAWAFLVYILVMKLNPPTATEEPDNTSKRINQALKLLESSRQRNQELQEMIDTLLK